MQCYKLALKLFRDSCEKVYTDEITGDDLRQFKVFLRQQQTTVGTKIDPRSPVGLKLAYCYWMELGRSPRFHTAKTLLAWSPQMDSLLAKSCLDYERFKWFLVWACRLRDADGANYVNDFSARYLRAARNPVTTLVNRFNQLFYDFFLPRANKIIPCSWRNANERTNCRKQRNSRFPWTPATGR